MTLEYISYTLGFIAAAGGVGGISTAWYYWKRFKKRFKIIPLGSWYKVGTELYFDETQNSFKFLSDGDSSKILIELNFLIINDSEINISITDALAMVRLSKERMKIDIGYPSGVFEAKPAVSNKLPVTVPPHSSKKIKLEFNFKDIDLSLIDRCGCAYFLGWLNDVPTFIASEIEKDKKWDLLPLLVRLVLHVDAENPKIVDSCVSSEGQYKTRLGSGTFTITEIEKAKKEFWR